MNVFVEGDVRRKVRFLKKVEEIVQQGWTQRALARNKDGELTLVNHPDACRWCVVGASFRAANLLEIPYQSSTIDDLSHHIRQAAGIDLGKLGHWNDRQYQTQESVLATIRKAIDIAARPLINVHSSEKYLKAIGLIT